MPTDIVVAMQLRETLRYGILGLIFGIPFICLIVADNMFFPFITGKNFTFRIMVEIMLGLWVLLMFVDAKYRPKFSWALVASGSLLAILTASMFLSENPYRSFWSNYERMEGLVTHAHLFLYFLILGTVLDADKLWKWFFRMSLGVSMIVAMYSFAQLGGAIDIRQSTTRIDATFGNSTYLAIYALMHIFLAVFLWVRDGARNSLRWIYLLVAAVNMVILYYTQTRGTMLGLLGGTFLASLLVALFDREHPQLKKYAIGGIAAVVLLVGVFIAARDTAFVRNNPTLVRFAEISLSDATTQSRFLIWNMSLQGFKERPILGWGQDNFIYVFSKYYDPKMWRQEPWFDRSHNVFFDWLIAGGALGLLAYLSLFGVMLWYIWFGKRSTWGIPEKAIFTGMLAGYFIHNIFVFDNITSYLIFFALLAYVHSEHAEGSTREAPAKGKNKKEHELESQDLVIALAVIATATACLVYFVNIRNINANYQLIDALRNPIVDDGKGGRVISVKNVLDLDLFGTSEAREQLGQLAFQALDPRLDEKTRSEIFQLASQEFDEELRDDPKNLRYLSFAGLLYSRYANVQGSFEKAEEYFRRALEVSPKRQNVYMDFGSLYAAQGQYPKALELWKQAYELDKTYPDAALFYAIGSVFTEDYATADEVMRPFIEDKSPQPYDTRLINAYGNKGRFDKVVEIITAKISAEKAGARDYMALGGAYIELKENAKALASFETAIAMDPTLKDQIQPFIDQVK
jgi:O-antigen ligase/tetratricopeptide (TPR) repeat protein